MLPASPFLNQKDEPYLETHHIVWLSRKGADTPENTVALCPNCHNKIYVLDLS
ncbi:HNH endonuclease [Shewanella goraebulensis]|uniref:HNH endonuclease n=1 Tax=Shewanella goraebulensis TaxID=3050637 RepID=UPI003899E78E